MSLKKTLLNQKLEEWAKAQAKVEKLDAKKNEALEPFVREHNEKIAPVLADYDKQSAPHKAKAAELFEEIEALLKANVDDKGNPKEVTVNSGKATAKVAIIDGSRVISVQKFFDAVKDKNKDFWTCLNVVIKHAEKLLGKDKIDSISEKKKTHLLTVSLNK